MTDLFQCYQHLWLGSESPWQQEDLVIWQQMLEFLSSSDSVFQRSHPPGHFTASALVCDPSLQNVALLEHRKLGKWLQFGGHCDGDTCWARVALKEAEEESGLARLSYLEYEPALGLEHHPVPFDLDIHLIPARGEVPAHLHYDVRFLLWSPLVALAPNHESHQVGWFGLEQAQELTQEPSMLRQFAKLDWLRQRLLNPGRA